SRLGIHCLAQSRGELLVGDVEGRFEHRDKGVERRRNGRHKEISRWSAVGPWWGLLPSPGWPLLRGRAFGGKPNSAGGCGAGMGRVACCGRGYGVGALRRQACRQKAKGRPRGWAARMMRSTCPGRVGTGKISAGALLAPGNQPTQLEAA